LARPTESMRSFPPHARSRNVTADERDLRATVSAVLPSTS
jgi:hypothetical protein